MTGSDLALHEQVLLLVLTDRTGSLLDDTHFRFALAGAILSELLLNGYIELDSGEAGRLVTVTRRKRTGDPVLDDALREILRASRRTDPARWIERFSEHEELYLRVARQLCRKDVVKEHEGRVRLIFLRTVYVDLEPEVADEVTGRIRRAVFEDGPVDARTALVASLASAGHILRAVFGDDAVEEREERIRNLMDHAEMSDEIRASAREAEAAVVTATDAAVLAAQSAA
jgi:hypothetical protein